MDYPHQTWEASYFHWLFPSVMFVVSLAVKRHLKKDTSSNEQERVSEYQRLQGDNIAKQQL